MTLALVHGLPETAEVWEPLQAALPQPSVVVRLPGFGAQPPAGFDGSKEVLAGWLAARLRALPQPVDVVAHDLGALLILRVVTAGLVPVRRWAVDVADLFHPDAAWPERVRRLQRPEEGEALLAQERAVPGGAAVRLAAAGVPSALAERIAAAHDERMDRAVLAFYRSAHPNAAAGWWRERPGAVGRGLVLQLPDPPEVQQRTLDVAAHLRAGTADLGDVQHCWMAQDPHAVAAVLGPFLGG